MMCIAYMLRPWQLLMRTYEVVPRALADDLLITTDHQHQPLLRFELAFEHTCEYLADMGAKVAAHKSKLFASHPPFKKWLETKIWRHIDTTVPVVAQFRDLGSTATISKATFTAVSRERISKAITTLKKIANLPHDIPVKATFARASALAQALYACEASSVDEVMLARLAHQLTT
eukprot:4751525-Karenia_brevis.AAC.1